MIEWRLPPSKTCPPMIAAKPNTRPIRVALSISLFDGNRGIENTPSEIDNPADYLFYFLLHGDLLPVGKGDDRVWSFLHENDQIRVYHQTGVVQSGKGYHVCNSPGGLSFLSAKLWINLNLFKDRIISPGVLLFWGKSPPGLKPRNPYPQFGEEKESPTPIGL
jgi:hypothetical protein